MENTTEAIKMLIRKPNFDTLMPAIKKNRGRNSTDFGGSDLSLPFSISVCLKNFMNLDELLASDEIFNKFPRKTIFFWIALIFSLEIPTGCLVVCVTDLT
jgi:hypothetical protein